MAFGMVELAKLPREAQEEILRKLSSKDVCPIEIDEQIYYQQKLKFVTPDTGASKPRPGEHEDSPEYEKPKEKKLDGNYPIIGT